MMRQLWSVNSVRKELTFRCMCTSVESTHAQDARTQKLEYMRNKSKQQNVTDVRPAEWDAAKPYDQIPGPKPIPFLGNIWRFLPGVGNYYGLDQITQQKTLKKEFGDILKLSKLRIRKDIVMLFDPEDIEMTYRHEGVWPIRNGLESLVHYRMNVRQDIFQGQGGVLTGQGETWYKVRSVVNPPMMQPRSAALYVDPMDKVAQDFMEKIRVLAAKNPLGEMPEDFSNELNKWALESICCIGLNKRLGLLDLNKEPDAEAQQFIHDVLDMFDVLYELDVQPSIWKWVSTPTYKKELKILDRITAFEKKHLDEACKKLENEDLSERSEGQMSILERLLKTDRKIAFAMVFDMLVAGIDTTSRTSAAALYFLAANPKAQQKLRDELTNLLPKPDSPITNDKLQNMPYLRAVIKETTRLAPIAVGNLRSSTKDLVLSGYQIPKDTEIMMGHMLLCREEKYFPRPNDFIPDRWLRNGGEEYQSKDAHPFVYLPFGFGPRSCIGKRLANLEMEVLLAKLIRNYEVNWPHGEMKWIMNMLYGVGSPLKFHMKQVKY